MKAGRRTRRVKARRPGEEGLRKGMLGCQCCGGQRVMGEREARPLEEATGR